MNNIELGIKNDLMFFDNVKSTEAENLSKIYSNYVFFSDDLYNQISLETCVSKRISKGGTGPDSVKMQIDFLERICK